MSLLNHHLDERPAESEDSEVILLLNGGMMSWAAWAPVAAGLNESYRLLSCDFRGQLRSPGPSHARLEGNLPDLVALLDSLDLPAVHVLATSFGAEVGLLLAAHHPDRVRSLAAVAAVDRTPPKMAANSRRLQDLARQAAAGGDATLFHDAVVEGVYSATWREAHTEELKARAAQVAALPPAWYEGLLGILESIQDFDLTPYLGRITCPTLVVGAADDIVMPLERVEALAAAIPGARLEVHPTAGHVLVLEDPEWLVRRYRQFLTSTKAG